MTCAHLINDDDDDDDDDDCRIKIYRKHKRVCKKI